MNHLLTQRWLFFFAIVLFGSMSVTSGHAQERDAASTVKGIVVDETDLPLPGATIIIKNTQTGTSADANGKFSIQAKPSDILQISYIGYESLEIPVNSKTELTIRMKADANTIEDVQVIAYGTQKKVTVTGAIASVGGADLVKSPSASIANVMAGTLTGVSTVQYSGQPGADDAEIYVRGTGSLDAAASQPLILVDGVERAFTRMDPNEIESVTVLKDASATVIISE